MADTNNMDDMEMCLDRIGMCVEALDQEKAEILGLILSDNFFEAGMRWKDYESSIEGLKIELSEARALI